MQEWNRDLVSLHEFIVAHTEELLTRSRAKVTRRSYPHPSEAELEHGIPLLLLQVAMALDGAATIANAHKDPKKPDTDARTVEAIARSARLHEEGLSTLGFTLEQVVYDYGEVCRAVGELALEHDAAVTDEEFHVLDRCLDSAVAAAITSWGAEKGIWHLAKC
jgi:hypothetical protein